VASLSQGRTAAAQCGLFTYKSVPVIFEPPCINATSPTHERLLLLQFIKYDRDVMSWQVLCEPKTNFNCFL